MNSQLQRAVPSPAGILEPVGPSATVRFVMRPMTKALNPVIVRLAGGQHFHMAGQIRHVGRRSGRTYITPVSARRSGDRVLIALTFGNQSDWARNVRAAGGGSIRINGTDLEVVQPQFVNLADARPLVQAAFTRRERAGFRLLGIRQVMILQVQPAGHRQPLRGGAGR
jgi:deazaflavin-dependent oxidoreductase (nitroreductase family)